MPVAVEHDLIFVHIPKSGGTSVMEALRAAGLRFELDGDGMWTRLTAHPRGAELIRALKSVYPINTIVHFPESHLPALLLREFVPADKWERSFKFAFVRNPWDLAVSTFFYMRQNRRHFQSLEPDYADVIDRCEFHEFVRTYPMIVADLTSMIADEHGEIIVDFVGRYERLEEDFATVCRRLNIDGARLGHLNRSTHDDYRAYYDARTRAIIERHFARDIERYGYSF